jgi:hypothetical protein
VKAFAVRRQRPAGFEDALINEALKLVLAEAAVSRGGGLI